MSEGKGFVWDESPWKMFGVSDIVDAHAGLMRRVLLCAAKWRSLLVANC